MTSPPARSVWGVGPQQRADAWAGLKAIAPLMPGSALFGMAFGAVVRVAGIDPWAGLTASFTVVAGASQIALVEALRAGAPAIIAVLTALIINARFALYSAALAPLWAAFPRRWRFGLAYLMTDQSAVVSLQNADAYPDPVRRRWFTVGAAFPFVVVWWIGTAVGIALGPVIPAEWQIGFIVPLMFIAVLVPGLRRPAELVTILAASAVVLGGHMWPFGLNVFFGIVAGITAGALFEPWWERRIAARELRDPS
jgi:4-azaleucine resistance transporter AzlC